VGNNNATSTFAGTIKDNNGTGGTVALAKVGSGTQTLTGTNTYTGTTTVTGGTLQVGSGGVGSTGTGATTVGDGTNAAALAGSGTVSGTVNVTNHVVKAAATLKPGDAAGSSNGSLTFNGNLNLNSNSVTQLQVTGATTSTSRTFAGNVVGSAGYNAFVAANVATWNSAASGNHDHLDIQGTLTLGTNASGLIQIVDNGYTSTAQRGDIFDLLDWNSVTAGSFNVGTNYRTSGLGGGDLLLFNLAPLGLAWDVSQFTTHGILIVVPEPSRAMLLMGAIVWCVIRRRRNSEPEATGE
jgi:autotransporter-associated beta strand protein